MPSIDQFTVRSPTHATAPYDDTTIAFSIVEIVESDVVRLRADVARGEHGAGEQQQIAAART